MTSQSPNRYIVSLCMAGFPCRYNGTDKFNQIIAHLIDEGRAFPLCPELLGGLPTPREPVECVKVNGKLRAISQSGQDYTDAFRSGAEQVLKFAKQHHITKAILYKNSPSCGVHTYDGTFSGKLASYSGFTAQLLSDNGIEIISSADLKALEPNL